jgi:predicted flavoprotein YhiN
MFSAIIIVLVALLTLPTALSMVAQLVVVGGGAAGYFGAIEAAAAGGEHLSVIILEQGPLPLSKVKISGGGRCNVMHDETKVITMAACTFLQHCLQARPYASLVAYCAVLARAAHTQYSLYARYHKGMREAAVNC